MNQSGKKVTVKTIAEAMGISFSTVSKALNDDPLIKQETRRAVLQKAREMGYLPDMNAKSLRSKRTHTVGVIVNDIENPNYAHMLSVIAGDLAVKGYTTLICDSHYGEDMERLNIQTMLARNIDAIIISPVSATSENLGLLEKILPRTIVLGGHIPGLTCNYINVDYALGGYLSAKELLRKGHTQNLVISEVQTTNISHEYLSGIQRAYRESGLSLDPSYVYHAIPSIDAGCRLFMDCLQNGKKMTGVLCVCDSFAYGVYSGAEKVGLRIPEDISIVGFDDYAQSKLLVPKLTTIYLPKERMARCCLELLNDLLQNTKTEPKIIDLEPHLVERDSVMSRYHGDTEKTIR